MFWDTMSCGSLIIKAHFGLIHFLHLQGQQINHARNKHEAGSKQSSASCMLPDGFLLGLFFDPEDGCNIFLKNTG
jgi:hypothetical protein